MIPTGAHYAATFNARQHAFAWALIGGILENYWEEILGGSIGDDSDIL